MAQLLGANVHQQIFAIRILAIQSLNGILHGSGKLAVGAAELLKQHIAEPRIGLVDPDGEHEFLDMMIHEDDLEYWMMIIERKLSAFVPLKARLVAIPSRFRVVPPVFPPLCPVSRKIGRWQNL